MLYLAEVSGRELLQSRQGVHDDHVCLGPFHHLCVDSEDLSNSTTLPIAAEVFFLD